MPVIKETKIDEIHDNDPRKKCLFGSCIIPNADKVPI